MIKNQKENEEDILIQQYRVPLSEYQNQNPQYIDYSYNLTQNPKHQSSKNVLKFLLILLGLLLLFSATITILKSYLSDHNIRQKYLQENGDQVDVTKSQQKHTLSSKEQQRKIMNINISSQQLLETINQMQYPSHRPTQFQTKKSLQHIDDIYFAYTLSQNPDNYKYLQAEFYHYHQKYKIGDYGRQYSMCLVMVGKNIQNNYKRLYQSIKRQNYTNYHIIHIDDHSYDNTEAHLIDYLNKKQNYQIKNRTILIEQKSNKYALENRDIAIQYCGEDEIVVDIDSDDWLIGNQVLQLINTLYQENYNQLWLLYLNNIFWDSTCNCPLANVDKQIDPELIIQKKYRTSDIWRTTQLRTFRKDLYSKIDKKDFKNRFGNYYKLKSDYFIHFALVELAGIEHMKIIDQFVYFYQTQFSGPSLMKMYSRLASKVLTPYRTLKNLDDKPKRIDGYSLPLEFYKQFLESEIQYFEQFQKNLLSI